MQNSNELHRLTDYNTIRITEVLLSWRLQLKNGRFLAIVIGSNNPLSGSLFGGILS
jgi:hypothetical protein